jgi:hypothetical protein
MPPRKSNIFVAYVVLNLVVFSLVFVHARRENESARPALREKAVLVERLQLTDLCLFTDARYARNPSMADLHSPFQDSPMSMEHFPSGTILFPPGHLRTP